MERCDHVNIAIVILIKFIFFIIQSELSHWVDVLDILDSILERCCHKERENQWTLPVDLPNNNLV